MSFVKDLFGGGKQTTTQKVERLPPAFPQIFTGAGGSLETTGTAERPVARINLPSQIQELREEALGGSRALLGDIQGDIGTLRGLENPLIQARQRPIREEIQRGQRRVGEEFGRRGVFGTFRQQAEEDIGFRGAQALGEADVQARRETLDAILQRQAFQRDVTGDVARAGQELLAQELTTLGLSDAAINQIIQSQLPSQTTKTEPGTPIGETIGSLLFAAGGL